MDKDSLSFNRELPEPKETLSGTLFRNRERAVGPLIVKLFLAIYVLSLLAGCSATPKRNPVPPELSTQVRVPGIPEARFWGDEWPGFSEERILETTEDDIKAYLSGIYAKPHNYLAISGGGANGAFGAGLLKGMGEAGARPDFDLVTGVSTGALLAPFAFLGSDFDDEMEEVYTTTATKDVIKKRNIIGILLHDSLADTTPLKKLMAKYYTAEVIDAIGREYAKGRRLYIGTANLDAGRSVIWDIGAIAASKSPHKIDLIREVLRASASIPVAFPPILISVESDDGRSYDEIHVDGGTGSQVFVYPAAIDWPAITRKLKVKGQPRVYVIRNSFMNPEYETTQLSKLTIASRTIDSLIKTQGIGDLYQIFALCIRDGNDFNLAYIPEDFTEEPTEGFDPLYMRKLFDRGFELGRAGYAWKKAPPGFILEP